MEYRTTKNDFERPPDLPHASFQCYSFFTLHPSNPNTRERQHVRCPDKARSTRQAAASGKHLDLVVAEFDIDNGAGREPAPVAAAAQDLDQSSDCGIILRILWDASAS